MESYKETDEEAGQELILPVVISGESMIAIENILKVIPRALVKYFDQEYYTDGLINEQDFLEWLSDGSMVDIRIDENSSYEKSEDHVAIECLGNTLIVEPVSLLSEMPDSFTKLKKYFVEPQVIDQNTISTSFEAFKVPLASVVASPASHNSDEELLNQICFTTSSIFFALQEKEIDDWRTNDFRVEVFLENDIIVNSNTRVLSTIEETGRIASTGFWVD